MDLPWGSETSHVFVTNVGLITTDGPNGPDIMSAEWTHHISYSPGLIGICLKTSEATYENVMASKEFGVNIAASDQNIFTSIAGGPSGYKVDKIKALQELGCKFYAAKKIKPLMVEGACLNAECKVINIVPCGDHVMFIGEVLEATRHMEKTPLIYHGGKYWRLGEGIPKPTSEELALTPRSPP